MTDTEVENILAGIRNQVRANFRAQSSNSTISEPTSPRLSARGAELLSRLDSTLETTSKAWNGFPALTSKRSGFFAWVELWIKRLMKRATHWYTWEQIEFNAAVNKALLEVHDVLAALAAQEQPAGALDNRTRGYEAENSDAEFRLSALDQRLTSLEQRLNAPLEGDSMHAVAKLEFRKEISSIRSILDDRIANLRDEQRVAFKQLSLEIRESAQDRS